MKVLDVEFVKSSTNTESCPAGGYPEFAFIGRSNVGKSSLINMLLNKKKLAKTSGTPGKTRTINHFLVSAQPGPWYAADLPGYGFAKTGRQERNRWQAFVRHYLKNRATLRCTFLLIDSRHEMMAQDRDFMISLAEWEVPFALVFTKCDKLTTRQLEAQIPQYMQRTAEIFAAIPNYFITSAETALGREQLLQFIGHLMN